MKEHILKPFAIFCDDLESLFFAANDPMIVDEAVHISELVCYRWDSESACNVIVSVATDFLPKHIGKVAFSYLIWKCGFCFDVLKDSICFWSPSFDIIWIHATEWG